MGHIVWDRFPRRIGISLSGVCDFAFVEQMPLTIAEVSYDDLQAVPGCFDAAPRYSGCRGVGVYRRSVRVRVAGWYRLYLSGIHHTSRVFVNGGLIGSHCGGFTQFTYDVELPAGSAEVCIAVDNRTNYQDCPLHIDYFDWYHFGGITEEPLLLSLPENRIDRVSVQTMDHVDGRVSLTVHRSPGVQQVLRVHFDGRTILQSDVDADEAEALRVITCPGAELWSPEHPNLHELEVELGDDVWRQEIGLRTIAVRDAEILLNGEPITLYGVNRHEAHPQFGHAVPTHQMAADVGLLRDIGMNFVRGSHYPQSERFLDLCDRAGILVWSEAIGWQHTVAHLSDESFLEAQERHIEEMIEAGANHPSVLLWGLLNESESNHPEARSGYERLITKIRVLDPSRPVTYASNHVRDDLCMDLVDVVSINTYPGWYSAEIDDIPDFVAEYFGIIDNRDGLKPIIVSEIGAGAVPGCRDWNRQRWSEDYQAELVERVARWFLDEQHRAVGLALWQYSDIRTSENLDRALGRPRNFNNKGIVDEYRRPKLAVDALRRIALERHAGRSTN